MSHSAPAHAPDAAPAATASHGYTPSAPAPYGSAPPAYTRPACTPPAYAARSGAPTRAATPPRPAGAHASPAAATGARYRDAELASAAPGQLVVMLFDKCLLTVRRAGAAFAAGDVEARTDCLCRAGDMIAELRASLDFDAPDAAGAISRQLDALYAWTQGELFAANREQAPARLDPVLRVLGELREAFAGAQAQLAAEGAGAPAAAFRARSA
jgi:flagellar protein FliS